MQGLPYKISNSPTPKRYPQLLYCATLEWKLALDHGCISEPQGLVDRGFRRVNKTILSCHETRATNETNSTSTYTLSHSLNLHPYEYNNETCLVILLTRTLKRCHIQTKTRPRV